MATRTQYLLGGLALALVLFYTARKKSAAVAAGEASATDAGDFLEEIKVTAKKIGNTVSTTLRSAWLLLVPDRLKPTFDQASATYGLPENLLARVAYQESHFRQDIISGKTVSSAGAVGIMQLVPKWHPNVNPLDPFDAIPYAARYLRQLFNQFGSWELALAAYNWGPGNLKKDLTGKAWPQETINYVNDIAGDVGLLA